MSKLSNYFGNKYVNMSSDNIIYRENISENPNEELIHENQIGQTQLNAAISLR